MDVDRLQGLLADGKVIYLPIKGRDKESIIEAVEAFVDDEKTIVYLSASKSARTRRQEMEERGIAQENVFFIDASGAEEQVREENVVFVNPSNLTQLSISLSQAVQRLSSSEDVIVMIDALESLGLYSDERVFKRFLHIMCNKMRTQEVPVLLVGTEESLENEMQALLKQFTDETFDPEA